MTDGSAPAPGIQQVTDALRRVIDPELGVSVVDLGLIDDVEVDGGHVLVTMSLTSPGCPISASMAEWARRAVRQLPGVRDVEVTVTSASHPMTRLIPAGRRAAAPLAQALRHAHSSQEGTTVTANLLTDSDAGRAEPPRQQTTWPAIRALAWVVLAVMAAALAYAGWIALSNFDRISV